MQPLAQDPTDMSSPADIVICSDPRAVSFDAAYRFVALSAATIAVKGRFTVALAGGSTPALLYTLLASVEFRNSVDWTRVHLFFGDERFVPSESPESNYKMASETLIEPIGLSEANVHRITTQDADPGAAAARYSTEIKRYFGKERLPEFDLVLLGMGPDGHTASLFPNSPALQDQGRLAAANDPGLKPWVPRITLTLPVLNAAANVIFLVAGASKAQTIDKVFNGPFSPAALPAQAVRPPNRRLTWIIDRPAAGRLASTG